MLDNNGWALMQAGRYTEAAELFAQCHALPLSAPVSWANNSIALILGGRSDEALEAVRFLTQGRVKGDWNQGLRDWSDGLAAWVLAEAGARQEARSIADRLLQGSEAQRFAAGLALMALDRQEEGFAALAGLPQQLVPYLWLLIQKHEELSANPRFQQLLGQLKAAWDFQAAHQALASIRKARGSMH